MAKEWTPFDLIFFVFLLGICPDPGTANFLDFKRHASQRAQCDLSPGEWIYDPSRPPYTSLTCDFITNNQNCMKYGRSDEGYLHWRWKPHGCDFPSFDPNKFLSLVQNKHFGSIGDSVVRNQIESLLCLLSQVEKPVEVYGDKEGYSKTWYFPSHNFTLALVWSEYLLKSMVSDFKELGVYPVHLDILGDWSSQYESFDYVLFGTSTWFTKNNTVYVVNDTIVGCNNCQLKNVPNLGEYYPYQIALNSTFRFITSNYNYKPEVTIYRSHTPNHYQHGKWYNGGFCNDTAPFNKKDHISDVLSNYEEDQKFQAIGKQEFVKAAAIGQEKGIHIKFLDVFQLSLLRPDGHPCYYRPSQEKADCLHWCLPGPIDTWNYLMMELLLKNDDLKDSS